MPGPALRRLASGTGWTLNEFTCDAGPADRPFEERHDTVSIAVVVEGSFNYASTTGRALLHPGALLFGNFGACYQCGHSHSTGDRCITLQLDPAYFAEIAATAAGSSQFRFPVAMVPPNRAILPIAVLLEAAAGAYDPIQVEEELASFAAVATHRLAAHRPAPLRVSAMDERRISRVLSHIDRHAAAPIDLDRMAAIAAMSKFHFLRVFRQTIGMTPYQYLLSRRLRAAVVRLRDTADAVTAIALDCGFEDLSAFNRSFRAAFGKTPSAIRRRALR